MKKLKYVNLIVFFVLMIISSCSKPYQETPTNSTYGSCITPYSNYAYQLNEIYLDFPEEIGPSEEWKKISTLPDPYIAKKFVYFNGDFWIMGLSSEMGNAILRYKISSQEWKIYPIGIETNTYQLFSTDSILWAITSSAERYNEPSALSRYNPQENDFEYVIDKDGLLKEELRRIYWTVVNSDGDIWLTDGYNLYEYNVLGNKLVLQLQASEGSFFDNFSISPENIVWIIDKGKKKLVKYSPNSGEVSEFRIPLEFQGTDELSINYSYIDQSGNLWFDDRGWVDLTSLSEPDSDNYAWYFVIRSPEFIVPAIPNYKHLWMRPSNMFEGSNGVYWFTSDDTGVVTLDSISGKWCKISTSGYAIEDVEKNVWILFNNALYMFQDEL